jgi:hypothetical protein
MTAGEDSRSFCFSSRLASLSPPSAFSERSLSSLRRSCTSGASWCFSSALASLSGISPLSFVAMAPGRYQVCPRQDLRRLAYLQDRSSEAL